MGERRPHWVYDAGEEPDPRFSLANERTFLAWVRTSLALIAGAVALHSLGVPDAGWARAAMVLLLVTLGSLTTVLAYVRWARVEHAMRMRQPLPPFTLGAALTVAVVLIGVLLAVVLLLG